MLITYLFSVVFLDCLMKFCVTCRMQYTCT